MLRADNTSRCLNGQVCEHMQQVPCPGTQGYRPGQNTARVADNVRIMDARGEPSQPT